MAVRVKLNVLNFLAQHADSDALSVAVKILADAARDIDLTQALLVLAQSAAEDEACVTEEDLDDAIRVLDETYNVDVLALREAEQVREELRKILRQAVTVT